MTEKQMSKEALDLIDEIRQVLESFPEKHLLTQETAVHVMRSYMMAEVVVSLRQIGDRLDMAYEQGWGQ
jgi:O-phosphoseryl-tRNA(Cys) synthetase